MATTKLSSRTPLRDQIRDTIHRKQTNICVSLDFRSSAQILAAVALLKDAILMVKLHCDIIDDFSDEFIAKLVTLCEQNDIFIFEDRKFSDIGNTFRQQFVGGLFKIKSWAHIVTFHGLAGAGQLKEFERVRAPHQCGLLVAEMSNTGNLLDPGYTEKVVALGQQNPASILGFVCQKRPAGTTPADFLCFTPGVKLREDGAADGGDQRYVRPSTAIEHGSDVLIVGRGIIESPDILETCHRYRRAAWAAYTQRA